MRNTVYIIELNMPDAGARDIHAVRMGKALRLAGLDPVLLVEEDEGLAQDRQADGSYRHEGIFYIPIGRSNSQGKLLRRIGVFLGVGNPSLCYIQNQPILPLAVIAPAPKSFLFMRVWHWCRRNGVGFIPEDVEWLNRADTGGLIYWLDMEIRMRILQRMQKKIIVNNAFLERYYKLAGCQVFRLPSLLDTRDAKWMPRTRGTDDSDLRLVFAGSPARDRQDLILGAISAARREGINVTIQYVGCSRSRIQEKLPSKSLLDQLGNAVVFHGRVPIEQVPEIMGQADYTVLLREDARWSRASFPSKVPEFFSLGIPCICNLTGNMGEYMNDGQEAFLVTDLTEQAFLTQIRRAVAAKGEVRARMGIMARKRAEASFDIQCFAKPLADFIRQ